MKNLFDIDEYRDIDKIIESELFFDELDEASVDKKVDNAVKVSGFFAKRLEKISLRRNKLALSIKSSYNRKIEKLTKLGKKTEAVAAKKDMTRKLERMHDSADVAELATKKKRGSVKDKVDDMQKVKSKETSKRNK
jgi:hypothetical protein